MKHIAKLVLLVLSPLSIVLAQTTGTPLNLALPNVHSPNWNIPLNANFVTLNTSYGLLAPKNNPTFTGTVTFPITGSVQCLRVSSAGVLSGSGADCGAGSVTTVFGRSGPTISAANGDYSFSLISGTVAPGQLPLATSAAFGAVKCDGTTIICTAGVISSTGGGGNTTSTSGTVNTLPKFNGANSIINSGVTDDGTTMTYTGSGSAHGFQIPEGTPVTGLAANDNLWADATSHRWMQNPNNIGALMIPGIATAGVPADCVKLAANGIDLVDTGAACGSGGGSLPTATRPGQIISSTAAGTTYAIQGQIFYSQAGDTISSIETECSSLCTYVVTAPQTFTLGASHSLSSNVQLSFKAGGLWTVNGAFTLTIPGNVEGTINQHFAGSSTIAGLTGVVPVEWFGAVGFSTVTASAAGSDYTSSFQNAINSLTGGGVVKLQCLAYQASTTPTIITSGVGIISDCATGQPNTAGSLSAPNAFIISNSASNNIISIHGTVATTYVTGNRLEHLLLFRTVMPTGTAAGVFSQFTCANYFNDIWSLDSIDGFYFNSSPSCNVGNFNSLMTYWGSGSVGPYAAATALHGINIDSSNGNAMLTAIFNQTAATVGANFGTADLASTYGIFVHGTAINDLNLYRIQSAHLAYGLNVQYTGSSTAVDHAADLHVVSPTWDTCVVACLVINGLPLTGTSLATLTLIDGNMNGASGGTAKAFDIENSGNISITNSQIIGFAGGLVNGSTNVIIANNLFNLDMSTTGYAFQGSSSSHVDFSHNSIYGTTAGSATMINGVSLTNSSIESNQLSGFASVGIALDSGSTGTVQAGNNIDPTNISTPYGASGPYFGIPWQFQQQLGLNTQYLITAASFGIQTQYKTTISGVDNWDWLSDAFGNLQFGDNTFGQNILKLKVGTGAIGFAAVGSSQRLGFMPSFITADGATPDTALSRESAGVIDVGNGTLGDKSGTLNLASLLATGIADGTAPVTITTGTTATLGGTFRSGYTLNQEATAATAVAYTLPTAAVGRQYCVGNSWNGTAATTGVLTVATSATGQFIIFTDGTLSATGGNVTSGGAAADAACFVGVDATHWQQYTQRGTWVKH